jgi:hypothetical protein
MFWPVLRTFKTLTYGKTNKQDKQTNTADHGQQRVPPGIPVSSTINIEKILISLIIGSSEGGIRSRDEESGQTKCEI